MNTNQESTKSQLKCLSVDELLLVFEFLDLRSLLMIRMTTKHFYSLLSNHSTLVLSPRLPIGKYQLMFPANSFEQFCTTRNMLVSLYKILRASLNDNETNGLVYPATVYCQEKIDSDPCNSSRIELFLQTLLLEHVPLRNGNEDRLLEAVFSFNTIEQYYAILPRINASPPSSWPMERSIMKLLAFLKKIGRDEVWKELCRIGIHDPAADAAAAATIPMEHPIEAGMTFLGSMQLQGYNQQLVNDTLNDVANEVFQEVCPLHLSAGVHAARARIASMNRFKVLNSLIRVLFHPRPSDPPLMGDSIRTAPHDGYLGLRGSSESEYYTFNSSFPDKVIENGHGIPLALCAILCMASSRIGLTGINLMNLPKHVQCGLSVRIGIDEPPVGSTPGFGDLSIANDCNVRQELRDIFARDCVFLIDAFEGGPLSRVSHENEFVTITVPDPLVIWLRAMNNISSVTARVMDASLSVLSIGDADISLQRSLLTAQSFEFLLHNVVPIYFSQQKNVAEPHIPLEVENSTGNRIRFMHTCARLGLIQSILNEFKSWVIQHKSYHQEVFEVLDKPLNELLDKVFSLHFPAKSSRSLVLEFLRCVNIARGVDKKTT